MTNGGPLVSILTPCFEHERYLDDYFEGLLRQSYRNFELVLIDDCSSDRSWEIIRRYEPELREVATRVVVERHEENVGLLQTMAELVPRARGELLCILESDDYYLPQKLARNVTYLEENPRFAAAHSDVDVLREDSGEHRQGLWGRIDKAIPTGDIFENLLHDNFIVTSSFCCRTEIYRQAVDLDRYRTANYLTVDYPSFLDIARMAEIGYLDERLACYRVVPNSISHPNDLRRLYAWRRNYYQVKLDYANHHDVSPDIQNRAMTQFHHLLYRFGWALRQPADFEQGLEGLEKLRPSDFRHPSHRLRRMAIRSRPLWAAFRIFERSLGRGSVNVPGELI